MRNKDGNITTNRDDILEIVESVYCEIYAKKVDGKRSKTAQDHIPGIKKKSEMTPYQIKIALSEIKNTKSPGDDRIVMEAINLGGYKITQALAKLFTKCIYQGTTLSQLLHQNKINLTNYHPISLL